MALASFNMGSGRPACHVGPVARGAAARAAPSGRGARPGRSRRPSGGRVAPQWPRRGSLRRRVAAEGGPIGSCGCLRSSRRPSKRRGGGDEDRVGSPTSECGDGRRVPEAVRYHEHLRGLWLESDSQDGPRWPPGTCRRAGRRRLRSGEGSRHRSEGAGGGCGSDGPSRGGPVEEEEVERTTG